MREKRGHALMCEPSDRKSDIPPQDGENNRQVPTITTAFLHVIPHYYKAKKM
jgi:hypothetical protein